MPEEPPEPLWKRVVAQVSDDGGQTWSTPVAAPGFPGRGSIEGSFAPGVQPIALPGGRVVIPYYDEGKISGMKAYWDMSRARTRGA